MFLLGLLSIVQVAFLPGYLVLRCFNLDRGLIRVLVWSFALSLVINHLLVAGLVVLGIYHSATLYLVFAAELALLLDWTLPGLRTAAIADAASVCATRLKALRQVLPENRSDKSGMLRCILLGGAVLIAVGYGISGLMNLGQIFSEWDAVVSWNRWAIDWAGNRLPANTRDYPQLLPANWSITYVFIRDSSVWFFAKAIMPLFCLLLLLATIDLYGQTRDAGYLCGTMLTYWMLVAILRFRWLANGYAEVPVAFFAFATVYALLVARQTDDRVLRGRYVLLGAVLAAGAALTKQAGLFMMLAYPLLAWLFVFRSQGVAAHWRSGWRSLLSMLAAGLTSVAVAGPWYVYKEMEIRAGTVPHIASYLLFDIHQGRNVWERLVFGGGKMLHALTIPGACVLLVLLAASLRDPLHRWLTALIVVPFYLIWNIGFSYDTRNVALAIPFAGVAAGIGTRHLAELLSRLAARYNKGLLEWVPDLLRVRVIYLAIVLIVAAGILNQRITAADLRARQQHLQRSVGWAALNEKLYSYDAQVGFGGKIASDYLPLRWLPGLQQHYSNCPMSYPEEFQKQWKQADVHYVFTRRAAVCPQILSYIDSACQGGSMKVEATFFNYVLYKKSGVR
jgi:hypothetical protein